MGFLALIGENDGGGALLGGLFSLIVVFWIFAAIATVFWLWMLVDALTSAMPVNEKILWLLVIFFLHFIGALVYFIARRSSRSGLATR